MAVFKLIGTFLKVALLIAGIYVVMQFIQVVRDFNDRPAPGTKDHTGYNGFTDKRND